MDSRFRGNDVKEKGGFRPDRLCCREPPE